MDGRELVAAVRERQETALHRLGADKYLVAATGADLEAEPVLRIAARWTASGAETYDAWAAGESGPASETFAGFADVERDAYDDVCTWLGDRPDPADGGDPETDPTAAVHASLVDADDDVARTGATIGRALVADRTLLQVVNFFVNEGDTKRADRFRDLRSDANDRLDKGATLLDLVCTAESDWDDAQAAAERVVESAYEAYAAALEEMGVDPKPVC